MEIVNECKSHHPLPGWATPNATKVLGKIKTCSQIIAVLELTLDMNTTKNAPFNEVFIYTVCNYHGQSVVRLNIQIYRHKTNKGLPVFAVLTAMQ